MTENALRVRPLERTDLPALSAARPRWGARGAQMLREQEAGTAIHLLAVLAEDIVGIGELIVSERPELRNVHILEAWRGKGVGSAIVAEAAARAEPHGVLVLGVADTNHRARALYERLGFTPTGTCLEVDYEYVDDVGDRHHAHERVIELAKSLGPHAKGQSGASAGSPGVSW